MSESTMIILGVMTALIAIYGACLSTFVYNRDRSGIKVSVNAGLPIGLATRNIVLFIEAVNNGRRPVTITSLPVLILQDGYQLVIRESNIQNNPKLEEGDVYREWIELEPLWEEIQKHDHGAPKAVKFKDSLGRIYLYKFKRNEWKEMVSLLKYNN